MSYNNLLCVFCLEPFIFSVKHVICDYMIIIIVTYHGTQELSFIKKLVDFLPRWGRLLTSCTEVLSSRPRHHNHIIIRYVMFINQNYSRFCCLPSLYKIYGIYCFVLMDSGTTCRWQSCQQQQNDLCIVSSMNLTVLLIILIIILSYIFI